MKFEYDKSKVYLLGLGLASLVFGFYWALTREYVLSLLNFLLLLYCVIAGKMKVKI